MIVYAEFDYTATWILVGGLVLVLLCLLGVQLVSMRRNAAWVLSLRREQLMAAAMRELSQSLADPRATREQYAEILAAWGVRLADEISNQLRHEADFIPHPPKLGEPWPDFASARIEVREEVKA